MPNSNVNNLRVILESYHMEMTHELELNLWFKCSEGISNEISNFSLICTYYFNSTVQILKLRTKHKW